MKDRYRAPRDDIPQRYCKWEAEWGEVQFFDRRYGMRPGDVRTGNQSVTNTGHRGLLVLEGKDLDPTQPLSRVLTVTIGQTDPSATTPVYDGPLSGLGSVQLGTLEKDERRSYKFTVTWPASSDSPAIRSPSYFSVRYTSPGFRSPSFSARAGCCRPVSPRTPCPRWAATGRSGASTTASR